MCIFYSWCTKCNCKWLLEHDCDHVKEAERRRNAQYGCRDELVDVPALWNVVLLLNLILAVAVASAYNCVQYILLLPGSLSLSYFATNHNGSRHLLAKHRIMWNEYFYMDN